MEGQESLKIPDHVIIKMLILDKGKADALILELEGKLKAQAHELGELRKNGLTEADKDKIRIAYKKEHGDSIKSLKEKIQRLENDKDVLFHKLNNSDGNK